MQARHLLDYSTKDRVCRRLAAGDGLELFDRIPLDLDRDPLLGTVLSDDFIDALCNRSIRLGPPHAPEIEALQPLYRALDPLLSIARVTLFLLARSVPVQDKSLPQMIGTHSAFNNVEGFFVPVRALAAGSPPSAHRQQARPR